MNDLRLINDGFNIESLFSLVLIGVLFFALSIVVMVLLFSFSTGDALKNVRGMAALLIVSLSVPISVAQVRKNSSLFVRASTAARIENLEVVAVDENSLLVSFSSSKPVIAYLEYKDEDDLFIPLLPTYNLEKRFEHAFLVEDASGKRGDLYTVINDRRYFLDSRDSEFR